MSEKLLPIVPGCKALVVYAAPQYKHVIGSTVRCVSLDRDMSDAFGDRTWIIEGPSVLDIKLRSTDKVVTAPEHALMRIDGGKFSHEKDSHELGIKA